MTQQRLASHRRILALIDLRRREEGDPNIGKAIEERIIEMYAAKLAADITEDDAGWIGPGLALPYQTAELLACSA